MKAYFGRRYMFSASHRLQSDELTAEQNRATYGKCNNPHGHGHNYTVEVMVGGLVSDETGMVVKSGRISIQWCKQECWIGSTTPTWNLDPIFANQVPTTENLTIAIYDLLNGAVTHAKLGQVRVEETENNFFEYSGK